MLEGYTDDPGNKGLLRYNDERLEYLMRVAMNSNFQVNTHAIGDSANLKVLDNYERLIVKPVPDPCDIVSACANSPLR